MTKSLRFLLGILVVSSVWAALPASARAAEEEFQVTSVEVEGNKIVSSATVLAKIKTRPGDKASQAAVDEDIKRLYSTGFFTDVSADIRPYQEGKLVRFRVKERPLVAGIVITGSHHFRESKLREELKTKEQELLDRRQLKEDLERIKQLYRTKGFYLADIADEVKIDEATNKATIFINVSEGRKIRVRKILFTGNKHISAGRLRKAVATKQGWWFTAGYYRPEVLEEDMERVKGVYRRDGYSDVQASSQTNFDDKKRWLTITVTIDEGTRYVVGVITFQGVAQLPEKELRARLELHSGDPFSQERLSQEISKVQSAYFAKGYMAASVEPSTALNPQTNRVDVTYQVTEGTISYVDQVIIRGNLKTKDTVIRREVRLGPGERFDGEKLRRTKERLYNLGFFEEVTMETTPTDRPDRRNLVVSVKESKTGEFSFGGGFSSVDKVIGFAEIVQRNFDLFNWPTFVGGGQELKFQVAIGSLRKDFQLSFTEPWLFNRPYLFGFDLFNTTRTRGEGYSFDLKRRGGDLRLGKTLGEFDKVGLTYRLEQVHVSDVPASSSAALKDEVGTNLVSAVQLGYTRDTRDNQFNPKSGYLLASDVEGAGSVLGGDKDFWKWTGSGAVFFEPFWKDQVLEFHLNAGLADSYGNSKTVPIFERFFAGGADTIRGYKERRIGPKDPLTNDPIGGDSIGVFNVEYTIPIVEFMKGAVFFDAGNVWSKMKDFGSGGFKYGTGLGARIKTPFGPVKLDYGFPLNPDKGEHHNGRLHFSASRSF